MKLVQNIFILALLCLFPGIMSQENKADSVRHYKAWGLRLQKGSILKHSEKLRPVYNSYPTGLEFDYNWHYASQKAYYACNCYSRLGTSLTFWEFNNPEILGYAVTSMFYVEPFFGINRSVSFSIRAGFGISFQTKPYHKIKNPDNFSYSTYFGFPLLFGIGGNVWLTERTLLNINANFNHISNGGIKDPNTGINFPCISIGIDQYLAPAHFITREKRDWKAANNQKNRVDFAIYSGYKERKAKTFYAVPGMELKASRQVARISAVTLGLDFIYDRELEYDIPSDLDQHTQRGNSKFAVAMGHEFVLGKVLFSQQYGVYLYNLNKYNGDVYQRYGLTYHFTKRWFAGINIKAYYSNSQFFDFRVGYSFIRK